MALNGFTLGSGSTPSAESGAVNPSSGGALKGFSLGTQSTSSLATPVTPKVPDVSSLVANTPPPANTSGAFSKFMGMNDIPAPKVSSTTQGTSSDTYGAKAIKEKDGTTMYEYPDEPGAQYDSPNYSVTERQQISSPDAPPEAVTTNPIVKAITGGTTLKQFGSDVLNGLPDASKEVSDVINAPFNKTSDLLSNTTFIKQVAAGLNTESPDSNSMAIQGYRALQRLSDLSGTQALQGATGGLYQAPETGGKEDFIDSTLKTITRATGQVAAIEAIGAVAAPEIAITGLTGFLNEYPLLAKYAAPYAEGFVKSLTGLTVQTQLDPNLAGNMAERGKQLATAIGTAPLYTALGTIKAAGVSIPASFALGFGMAKLSGASNKDAIQAGIVLGIMDGVGRIDNSANRGLSPDDVQAKLTEEALQTLNPYATTKLTKDSSLEDIKSAYHAAIHQVHPDVGGTHEAAVKVNNAYDLLTKGAISKSPSASTEPEKSVATLKDEVQDALAEHGEMATHTALQENLGVDAQTADRLIQAAKAPSTDTELDTTSERALNIATAPKALKGFKVNDVEGAFNESKEQSPVGDFELGSFGKNAIERKSDQSDRFPISELEETAKHIVTAYKGSNNFDTYRKDNIAHIAEMPDGERRVIYTRQNANGKEEIINAHKISNPAFEEQLKSFGTPERSRTAIRSLEGSSPNPLEDRGTSKVDELVQDVKEIGKPSLAPFESIATDTGKTVPGPLGPEKVFEIPIKDLYAHGIDELQDAKSHIKNGATSRTEGPIEVTQTPLGQITVLDGQHRALEALADGKEKIATTFVPYEDAINPEFGYTVRNLLPEERKVPIQTHGFVKIPALPDVGAKIAEVKDFIEHSQKTTELTGTVSEAIYQHEGARKANRQRAIQLLQARGADLTPQQWETLYHHDEDPENVELTPAEQDIYDSVILPLKKALTDARAEYRALGGVITADLREDITPRFAKEKGGPIDSILALKKKGEEAIRNGGLMSKSVGSGSKHRVFHVAVNEEGVRTVVHIPTAKKGKVTAFKKGMLTDLGTINFQRRETLLKDEIAPLKKKLKTVQRLITTLESVKTRDPVSSTKLSNLEARIEALKQFSAERAERVKGYVKAAATFDKDIEKANARAANLSTRLAALKKFGNIPRVAKEIEQMQQDIDAAYEHETNLSLSDIYENLSEFVDRNDATDAKLIRDLAKTTSELKTLSKIPKGEDVVLTKARIANAIDKMRELTNEIAEIEVKYDPEALEDRVFRGADKKAYQIKQATTKEIEENTNTRYHKNPFANYILSYDRTTNALSALKLLNRLKETPEFSELIVKQNPDESPPEGWKDLSGVMPQFRGYYAEPKLAEALQDLATRLRGREHFPVLDEVNNLLTTMIVINPIMHLPNVLVNALTTHASMANLPGMTPRSARNFARAVNEVKNKGPLFLHYLEHGAPLMSIKNTAKDFTEAVLTQYSEEVKENPEEFEAVAKILGYASPKALFNGFMHINEAITWGGSDIMFLHAILDYSDTHDVTPEEAIRQISKNIADYRLPSRIGPGKLGRAVSLVMQSRGFLFARYHYSGVIKPWIANIRDSVGPGATRAERLAGLRALAFLGLLSLVVYPYINKMLRGLTGDGKTYISMSGAAKLVQNAEKLHEAGPEGVPAFVQGTFTLSPALTAAIELGFNVDLYTRNPIYGPLPAQGLGEFGVSMISPLSSSARMSSGDFALSLFGIYTPKSTPSRNDLYQQKYDELPALQAQVKRDIVAGNTAKANAEMAEFNNRAIANYNSYQIETGGKPLAPDGSETAAFLKEWGISTPGQKALANTAALYGDGSLTSKSSLLDGVVTYAKAIGTDPATAFERIFTGQRIVKVDNFAILSPNSAVIVERLPLASSEAIRSKQAAAQGISKEQLGTMQLDHFIPLEAGGTNEEYNLDLVTTYQNEVLHNDIESPIAAALKAGTISRAKAQEYLVRYKIGTLGENPNQHYVDLYKNKYGSQPITAGEVAAEISSGKAIDK